MNLIRSQDKGNFENRQSGLKPKIGIDRCRLFRDFDLIFSEFRLFLIKQSLKILRPLIFNQSVKENF